MPVARRAIMTEASVADEAIAAPGKNTLIEKYKRVGNILASRAAGKTLRDGKAVIQSGSWTIGVGSAAV